VSVLSVRDLRVDYRLDGRAIRAVDGVSFELEAGRTLGLVGESGSGKTTLVLSLLGLLPANGRVAGGSILFEGRELTTLSEREWETVRWSRIALVFQGGMNALNPVQRVVEQIVEPIVIHEPDTGKREARARAEELLIRVGIPRSRIEAYPHEYSGGMRQRAGIAMALACNPSLVIADEPVTALDVVVQAQILQLLGELQEALDLTLLIITHDLGVVAQLCHDVLVMYAAEIVERGTAREIFHDPRHPYTALLLGSVPRFDRGRDFGHGVPGTPPSLASPPSGCRLHPRCPSVMPVCPETAPPLVRFGPTHSATCHLHVS
jgi:oligopeptide/dipeptide ABC transporter ATP-binding protein